MNRNLIAGVAISAAILTASSASASTCTGSCGVLGPDGVITAPPSGTTYNYVTTANGVAGAGQIAGVGGTNGSEFRTGQFSANAGDPLNFYFNFATTDGSSSFPDYAFAELLTGAGLHFAYLFTARTTVTGNTSPGFGLPPNDATLTPATTPIIAGAPTWSPLGAHSGQCFSDGCGYTGWIGSTYAVPLAGAYILRFGASNFGDSIWDTGLAFSGVTIGGNEVPIGTAVPEPATWAMLILGMGMVGASLRLRRRNLRLAA